MTLSFLARLAAVSAVVAMGALYVCVPPNPDQSIFDYAGWVGAHGGRYYVDVAEQNFPGAMMVHELAQRLFGNHIWTFRAMDFLVLLAGAAALFDLLRRAGMTLGAWVCLPLYAIEYTSSGQWMAGQRDLLGANLLLVAAAAFVRRANGGPRAWLACIAGCTLLATLLRPSYVVFGLVLVVIDVLGRRRTGRAPGLIAWDAVTTFVAAAAGVAALIAYGASTGGLAAWWQQSIQFNLEVYAEPNHLWGLLLTRSGLFARNALLLAVAAVGFVASLRSGRARGAATVLGGLVVTALVSTIVQGKGYGYHLGALIPACCGLAAIATDLLAASYRQEPARRMRLVALAATASALLVSCATHGRMLGPQVRYLAGVTGRDEMLRRASTGCPGLDWKQVEDAVAFTRAAVPEDETVLVWSRAVGINVLSERRSPTRYITHGMLCLARPPFSQADTWMQEFRAALQGTPPRLVFAPGASDPDEHEALWGTVAPGSAPAILRAELETRYERVAEFGSLEAWRLRLP